MDNLETTSPLELMTAIAIKLGEINNILYPKLDCMPFANDEEMGRLKATYHALANSQAELIEYIRGQQ